MRPDVIGEPTTVGTANQWFANSVCDPRIAGSCTSSSVFALPVSANGVFLFGNLAIWNWAIGFATAALVLGIMLLELFVALLQAYVFALLTSVFIGLMQHEH